MIFIYLIFVIFVKGDHCDSLLRQWLTSFISTDTELIAEVKQKT
jgi:hypothetical protein